MTSAALGEEKLLGMLGLCRRAGKLVMGVPMICDALKERCSRPENDACARQIIVIEAGDCSENTHKRISDKCAFYKVEHIKISSGCQALGAAVGKTAVAAVLVTDRDMYRAVLSKLPEGKK